MRFIPWLATFACAVLTACAGTTVTTRQPFAPAAADRFSYVITPQVEVPAASLVSFDARLRARLVTQPPTAVASASRDVDITITRYTLRGPARVDAPLDAVTSQVTVRDAATGAVIGAFTVESRDKGEWRTPKILLDEHADRIAAALRGRS
jgi:hypothetical protein